MMSIYVIQPIILILRRDCGLTWVSPYLLFFNPFTSSEIFYHNSLNRSISTSMVSGLLLLCFIKDPVFNANNVDPDQRRVL